MQVPHAIARSPQADPLVDPLADPLAKPLAGPLADRAGPAVLPEAAPVRSPGRAGRGNAVEWCDCVIDIAAALFNVSGRELRRPGRSTLGVTRVRQIAMYVSHVVLGLSMGDVGRGFGRDRTTVLYACHLVEDLRDEPEFDRIVSTMERVAGAAFRERGAL